MDWAEELKMSIRKTTARKGRRSKSKDLLKDGPNVTGQSSSTTPSKASPTMKKEISIDITLDMQSSTTPISSTTATPPTSSGTVIDSETKRPPIRRISGGWADTSLLKSSKYKKGSFDDERFQFLESTTNSPSEDEIPIVPDMDDIKDEIILNEIVEPPSVSVNRVVALKELNSDLLSQNAFSAIENVDLSILTRCLQPQDSLDESDEVWEWEKLFTDVIAEIHSENKTYSQVNESGQKIEIGPDEVPPIMNA